jgi:hypothetical protein
LTRLVGTIDTEFVDLGNFPPSMPEFQIHFGIRYPVINHGDTELATISDADLKWLFLDSASRANRLSDRYNPSLPGAENPAIWIHLRSIVVSPRVRDLLLRAKHWRKCVDSHQVFCILKQYATARFWRAGAELRHPIPRSAILEKLLQRIEEAERRIAST